MPAYRPPARRPPRSAGPQVPSQITQRQFNTTVELREGQTLTVAGLIQNNFSGTSNRVPFWGDLPIIGRTGGVDSLSLRRAGVGRPGHARAGPSLGAVQDAAAARQRHFRAGRRGVLSLGALGRPAQRGLPRVGPHRLRPPKAIVRVRRPVSSSARTARPTAAASREIARVRGPPRATVPGRRRKPIRLPRQLPPRSFRPPTPLS